MNSRVNRITKLTPNKVTKQDVPRLVSLSAETTVSQKPQIWSELSKKNLSERASNNRLLTKLLR